MGELKGMLEYQAGSQGALWSGSSCGVSLQATNDGLPVVCYDVSHI